MCHPKLPKKLYNRLIINLDNLFVQKCDEVKMPEPLKGFYVLSAVPLVVRTSRRKANGISPKSRWSFAEKPTEIRRKANEISPKGQRHFGDMIIGNEKSQYNN